VPNVGIVFQNFEQHPCHRVHIGFATHPIGNRLRRDLANRSKVELCHAKSLQPAGKAFQAIAARLLGIETVYQDLAVAPALDIASNLFLGRELRRPGFVGRVLRLLDKPRMRREAERHMADLKFRLPSITHAVEDLSGGQRQGVAVARAAAFARRLVIMDEPTAALGVRETGQVLDLIRAIRERGLPVVLISHNMPNVFEVADRIHVMRLGRRVALTSPQRHSMAEVVAIMTGATLGDAPAANLDSGRRAPAG
jgi:fructose transport system ATP-binding protein